MCTIFTSGASFLPPPTSANMVSTRAQELQPGPQVITWIKRDLTKIYLKCVWKKVTQLFRFGGSLSKFKGLGLDVFKAEKCITILSSECEMVVLHVVI